MYNLLFYLFMTLLSFVINSQGLTQDGVYTIELVHRYSPKSPYYNSSMTLEEHFQNLAHHSAKRHHRHAKRLAGNEYDTDIIPNDGDYLIKIAIGSPPTDLYAVADTGSDLIWVQCQPCDFCYPQTTAIFDPSKSSSFRTLPCNSTYCANNPNFQCDDSTNQCEYFYAYGNGSTMSVGIMGLDRFTFSTHHASRCAFGCGLVQDGDYDSDAAGLVGLGTGPLSLISQLGPTIANKFSYCLNPTTSNITSRLSLGGSQPNNTSQKPAVTTPLTDHNTPIYYMINLKAIQVGQNTQEIAVNKGIVVDSGSTLTYIDAGAYPRLEALVKDAIPIAPMGNPPQDLRLCYEKNASRFEPQLNVTLRFDGGDILLQDTNLFLDWGDYVCFAIVPNDMEDDPMILGNVSQVNFEVEFDLNAKTVSFTPTICNQDHAPLANNPN